MKKVLFGFLTTVSLISFASAGTTTPPAMPSNVNLYAINANTQATGTVAQLYAGWRDNSYDETVFFVTIFRLAYGSSTVIASTTMNMNATGTYISVPAESANYTYYAGVQAYNQYGVSGIATSTQVYAVKKPAAPTKFALVPTKKNTGVSLKWNDKATNEGFYSLTRSRLLGGNYVFDTSFFLPANSKSYTDISVGTSTKYRYMLRVENAYGSANATNYVDVVR